MLIASALPRIKCYLLGLLAASWAVTAPAAESWLTIAGEPANPDSQYIQVNPVLIDIKGDLRVIPVRINRATIWSSPEGIQFRSVETEVLINCTELSAHYLKAAFYAEPDFHGEPFKVQTYAKDDIQPMMFKDIGDSPNVRIIKAACGAKNVTSN
ncbi:surface-adhesin E family protein [Polaromonas jejuensis]|uniref:Surface-adhesin E family protein n=1 Tax=Polaromonas jejuensis TaxID=457502 RepID=A0ABW0QCS2_9BURK|nr:surface-adhesin E family protein [Polaromonas jejuensis]